MSDNKLSFKEVMAKMETLKLELPRVLSNDTQRFFTQSFDKQGFTDKSLEPWAKRKKPKKTDEGRAILVQSGRLRRAVANSARGVSFDKIDFIVDVPYAEIHNDGGLMGKGGTMPKRQFMGESAELTKRLIKKINLAVSKLWRE
jgi:phage gpG-like protein